MPASLASASAPAPLAAPRVRAGHRPAAPALSCARTRTPLGEMLLAASQQGLCGAWFEGQRDWPDSSGWTITRRHPVLQQTEAQLTEYFAGQRHRFALPMHFAWGTPFQTAVWQALCEIDFGQTCSYADIARHIGRPQAMRAVGAAIGLNPISVIVPCHRVLGRDGSLTGYSGGLDRKRALLHLEGQ